MLAFDEALNYLLQHALPVAEVETVSTLAAAGRVLAQAQRSRVNLPPLDNSAMDGYAVACDDVPDPGTRLPISQRIAAGSVGFALAAGTAARIFTGAPIPAGADAVVMQEACTLVGSEVSIDHRPQPGDHVRRVGSDLAVGSEILPTGQRLRPQDVALAAAVGIAALPVRRRLRVAVLSTGDELRMPGEPLPDGAVYNANYFLLTALLVGCGCEVVSHSQVVDDLTATRAVLRRAAAEADLILSSGGVSVGEEDHVRAAVRAEGQLALWKIACKPGKPLAFGEVAAADRRAAFIGLPGNPVSSFVTFLLLVRPYVLKRQGVRHTQPVSRLLRADFDWLQPDVRREFLRAQSTPDGGVQIFPNQSSGVLTSAVWADGLIDNPPQQVIRRGDAVRFLPFSELLS